MAIFRGIGGAGDSTTDATVTAVTEQAVNAATSATQAASSASSAASSASSASTSATNAAASASTASDAATAASTSESNAQTSASNASTAYTNTQTLRNETQTLKDETNGLRNSAATFAQLASGHATDAETAETNAETAETNAETAYANTLAIFGTAQDVQDAVDSASASAATATTKASEASASASNASTSETNALNSETSANTSATNASNSATAAAGSATDANTYKLAAQAAQVAAEAAQSQTEDLFDQFGDQYLGSKASDPTVDNDGDPLTTGDIYWNSASNTLRFYSGTAWVAPETIATNAATAAQTAQTAAETAQAAAETAETNAETAETNAATSASSASTSATNAANSATSASNSATAASNSASAAATSATNAENAYDSFDDRYLGAKASDPSVDNDGDALIEGALYFNSTTDEMRVYTGSAWANVRDLTGSVDINGGTIDGVTIGGASAGAITGTTITGTSFVSSGDMTFGDNNKAIFGAGSDLQIYHDGTHSYVSDQGTGNIKFLADDFIVKNSADTDTMIQAFTDGAVTLWYDNAQKLATTNTGIDVTGTVTADGLTVDGDVLFDKTTSGANLVQIDALGGNNSRLVFSENNTHKWNIGFQSSDAAFTIYHSAGNAQAFRIANNRDISFYDDSGTSEDFYWDASLSRLGLGTTSPSEALHVQTGYSEILSDGTNNTSSALVAGVSVKASNYRKAGFTIYDESDNEDFFIGRPYASTNQFVISNDTTDRLRINNAGDFILYADDGTSQDFYWDASTSRLGIKTTSPFYDLHVKGNVNETAQMSIQAAERTGSDGASSASLRLETVARGGGDNRDTRYEFLMTPNSNYGNAHLTLKYRNDGTNGPDVLNVRPSGDIEFFAQDGTTSDFYWDKSTSRLGLGTTSPDTVLHVENGASSYTWTPNARTAAIIEGNNFSGTTLSIVGKATGYSGIFFGDEAEEATGQINYEHTVKAMRFATAGAEKMRIDSSGNLLVGRTSFGFSGTGHVIRPTFSAVFNNDGGAAITANRNTSDGTIVNLYKDGSTVGSIGTNGGNMYLGTGDVGIHFSDGANSLVPARADSVGFRDASIDFGSASYRWRDLYLSDGLRADTLKFSSLAGSEYGRFDSSGNLLVGTTNTNNYTDNTAGVVALATGRISASRSGLVAGLNRIGSDGDIVEFRKDGSTVGSIGTKGEDLYLGTGNTGFRFVDASNSIRPVNTTTASMTDGLAVLGDADYRFKDLYLSGGVYLGGTGSANLLDDYEEGTFTPSAASVTQGPTVGASASYSGRYTKIGRIVHCQVEVFLDSFDAVAIDDRFLVGNLPFTVNSSLLTGVGTGWMYSLFSGGNNAFLSTGVYPTGNMAFYVTHIDGSVTYAYTIKAEFTYETSA